jgi:hypothetical protein
MTRRFILGLRPAGIFLRDNSELVLCDGLFLLFYVSQNEPNSQRRSEMVRSIDKSEMKESCSTAYAKTQFQTHDSAFYPGFTPGWNFPQG